MARTGGGVEGKRGRCDPKVTCFGRRWSLAAILLSASLAAPAAQARPALSAGTSTSIALGVSVSDPGRAPALERYVSEVGQKPAVVMWFQSFDEPLYYSDQRTAVDGLGALPMISWEPVQDGRGIPLAQIASGAIDSYLRAAAVAAAAWHRPIFIRFAPEMNLANQPWGPGVEGNTPNAYVAAWRHIVTLFRNSGATNVRWVWAPNVDCGGRCPFDSFYPGDRWVDWAALDGYNYGPINGNEWMSLVETFGSSYDDITALTAKPLMITETASAELGGNKAAWITQAFLYGIPTHLPRVRAVVWWQHDDQGADWRVDSSPAALASFRAVAASPLYSAGASVLAAAIPSGR